MNKNHKNIMSLKEWVIFGILITLNMRVMVIKNRGLSLDEHLNKIKQYLRNISIFKIHIQNSDSWKIQLTITINFLSSKDSEEERAMHWYSDNIKFTSYSDANDLNEKLFK